jgi:hypothetical protein
MVRRDKPKASPLDKVEFCPNCESLLRNGRCACGFTLNNQENSSKPTTSFHPYQDKIESSQDEDKELEESNLDAVISKTGVQRLDLMTSVLDSTNQQWKKCAYCGEKFLSQEAHMADKHKLLVLKSQKLQLKKQNRIDT